MSRRPRLHLMHSSLQWSAPRERTALAVRWALQRAPHAVTFTEAGGEPVSGVLRAACKDYGYRLVLRKGVGTAVAVREDQRLLSCGFRRVLGPKEGRPRDGGRPAKYLTWARFKWETEDVFYAVGHWPNRAVEQQADHRHMTRVMAELVRVNGAGRTLGFWSGDVNVDDAQRVPFYDPELHDGRLTSVWDTLGEYPSTHGARTIDVIGTFDRDKRVQVKRARTWPARGTDHKPISAYFEVAR